MPDLSLTPELVKRLEAITCEDYAPLIVALAKTMTDADRLILFTEMAYFRGWLTGLVWKPPQPIKIERES